MTTIYIKRDDTQPDIEATLQYDDGSAIDLSGATVKFIMASQSGTVKVNTTATVVDAVAGKVKYQWQTGDTDTAGTYYAEFEVTFPGGKKLTVPNQNHLVVVVVDDLA